MARAAESIMKPGSRIGVSALASEGVVALTSAAGSGSGRRSEARAGGGNLPPQVDRLIDKRARTRAWPNTWADVVGLKWMIDLKPLFRLLLEPFEACATHVTLEPGPSASPALVDVEDLPNGALEVRVDRRRVEVDAVAPRPQLSVRVDGKRVDLTIEGSIHDFFAIANGDARLVTLE
jgi:hypothetical protein